MTGRAAARNVVAAIVLAGATVALSGMPLVVAQDAAPRTFATPKEAVDALIASARSGSLEDLLALFGPDGRELIASSDPATARANRDVFVVAVAEGWRLTNAGPNRRELVVGDEEWPFPVPLIKKGTSWRFDAALGKQEVLDRRIGRNELSVIDTCRTYVAAQRRYARQGHDGKPAGLFAMSFHSDPGKQNGLYWQPAKGEPRSPLGDLMAPFFPWATVFGKSTQLMSEKTVAVESIDESGEALKLTSAGEGLLLELGVANPVVPTANMAGRPIATADQANSALREMASSLARMSIIDIAVFFAVLLVGFAYVWKRGDLDWVRAVTRQHTGQVERAASADVTDEEAVLSA